jgi:hypothetical protein
MLHRGDGTIALTEAPYDLLDAFPVERDRWPGALGELAHRFAELADSLER